MSEARLKNISEKHRKKKITGLWFKYYWQRLADRSCKNQKLLIQFLKWESGFIRQEIKKTKLNMAEKRIVHCVKFEQDLPGFDKPPVKGELGQKNLWQCFKTGI